MFELVIFYFFAAVLVFAGLMVITARNPCTRHSSSSLHSLTARAFGYKLEAEFFIITLVLVYVGAVMVLFLFVVMMLDINLEPLREGFARYLPIGILVALGIVLQIAVVVGPESMGLDKFPAPEAAPADYSNTEELGKLLYTQYVYPFEIAAVILLVAIVAAIALTMRRRTGTRTQRPSAQIAVRREDRVRIVKMPAEKKG